jgi:tetratricopeptide (TPR) repeat protein
LSGFIDTCGANGAQLKRPSKLIAVEQLLADAKQAEKNKDFSEAENLYQQVLEIDPECVEAYFQLGMIYQSLNQLEQAEDSYRMALHYRPNLAAAYINLANLLRINGQFEKACEVLKQAIHLNPKLATAYFHLGMTLNVMGNMDEALSNYSSAIELDPADASSYNNMGLILLNGKGQIEEAESCFRKALKINPDLYDAKVNLYLALQSQGRLDQAIEGYSELMKVNPNDKDLNFYRSVAYLLKGNFKQGWQEYHARWVSKVALPQGFPYLKWDGVQSLTDKTLLIYTEQGLGDEIMFASCLPDILGKVERCILDCDPRMVSLFKRAFPTLEIHGGKKKQPDLKWLREFEPIDFQMPIGDLPKYFRNESTDFPQHHGYLKADPQRIGYWKERLAKLGPGLKVGISWRGGTAETRRDIRSIPLREWHSILTLPSVNFVSLQYTDCLSEIDQVKSEYGIGLHHWQEAIDDYAETAALVCALDLVVSVCTSIVHLSGGLGKSVWVLVPAVPEWRYLQQGSQLPWYPSARLFRQSEIGEWGGVLGEVKERLKK